jgi:hypothetical protein
MALLLPALAALVVWRLSLRGLDVSHLGDYGLPPALPLGWYCALLVVLLGASLSVCAHRFRGWLAAAYILAVVVMLFGTVAVVAAAPHYSWVYKHIGVTRLLETTGHANVNIDIYNRWPGFFALSAFFSRVGGQSNPVAYAIWAEVFFVSLDALLIAMAVKPIVGEGRIAAGAALLFVVANWIGQDYYAPQAFGFTLAIALLAVVLRQLVVASGGLARSRLVGVVERVVRVPQLPDDARAGPSWRQGVAIAVVLALDGVIVGSHQLTPYMLLAQLGLMVVLGLLRTRWFVAAMAVITFAYLAVNLAYIQRQFRLFTSIDPFNNVQHSSLYDQEPEAGVTFSAHTSQLLTFLVWLGAAAAVILLARRGRLRRALPLLALALAPGALVFGQNYGGEATLRVALFSFPWCAALIAWALSLLRGQLFRRGLTIAVVLALAGLFIPAYLGEEELNLIPAEEVRASNYFYAHTPAGAVLMQAAPDFPARFGPRYHLVVGPQSDDDPNLLRVNLLRYRPLGPHDIPDVISIIQQYSQKGFLVFAPTEFNYAKVFHLSPPGALQSLERAVASSPRFRLYYHDADTRIYELLPPPLRIFPHLNAGQQAPLYQPLGGFSRVHPRSRSVAPRPRGSAGPAKSSRGLASAGRRPLRTSPAKPHRRLSGPSSSQAARSRRSTRRRSTSAG